jgi:hypothetical protein
MLPGLPSDYSKCQKFCPNYPGNPLFRKKPVFRTFPAKTFIIFRDYIDALPHITGCTRLQQSPRKRKNFWQPLYVPIGLDWWEHDLISPRPARVSGAEILCKKLDLTNTLSQSSSGLFT